MNKVSVQQLLFLLLIGVFFIAPTSCKKGENDPSFSLRTRKARLTGDWTLKTAIWTNNDTTFSFENNERTKQVDGVDENPLAMTVDVSFEKEGTYEWTTNITFPENWKDNGLPEFTETVKENGIWNFTGGDDGYKQKERLLLLKSKEEITRSTSGSDIDIINFEGQTAGFVYDIDRLANKDLTLKYDFTVSEPFSQSTETGELKLEKK